MEVQELVANAREAVTGRQVYGDVYEKNGLTVIPAATVRGGGGGGVGRHGEAEEGRGAGFGLIARPSGAWIIEEGKATWKPAVDVNRIVLGGQIVALAAILVTGRILIAHSRSRRPLAALLAGRPGRRLRDRGERG